MDLCSSLTWVYLLNVTSLGVDPKSSFYLVSPGWSRNIQKLMCLRIVFWNFHGPCFQTFKIQIRKRHNIQEKNLFSGTMPWIFTKPFFNLSSFQFCNTYFLTANSDLVVHSCDHTLSLLTMTYPLLPFWPLHSF